MGICSNCRASIGIQETHCAACGDFAGFPNVKVAAEEVDSLLRRWNDARSGAEASGTLVEFDAISELEWQVVVTVSADVALNLITSPSASYTNYENLVGAGARAPAEFANDKHRHVVVGALFGNFGKEIIYGALSKGERGLSTYGDICFRLKPTTIRKRSSFMQTNSYDFVQKNPGPLPKGYRSAWEHRGKLAAVKLFENKHLAVGQSSDDWDSMLLVSDGKNKNLDEFLEAHIYGTFNIESIEDMFAAEVIESKPEWVEIVLKAYQELAA